METKELIPVELQNEVKEQVKKLIAGGQIKKIANPQQFKNAAELRSQVNKTIKSLDDKRLYTTSPLRQSVESINKFFNQQKALLNPV